MLELTRMPGWTGDNAYLLTEGLNPGPDRTATALLHVLGTDPPKLHKRPPGWPNDLCVLSRMELKEAWLSRLVPAPNDRPAIWAVRRLFPGSPLYLVRWTTTSPGSSALTVTGSEIEAMRELVCGRLEELLQDQKYMMAAMKRGESLPYTCGRSAPRRRPR